MRNENHYCSTCRCTRTFEDAGDRLHCPVCAKTLWRAAGARPHRPLAPLHRIDAPLVRARCRGTPPSRRAAKPLAAAS